MADYGNLQARAFEYPLPGHPQEAAQPLLQGQAPQTDLQQAPEGLQYHRDVTKGVYEKYYKLKSYASAMWKNYGINVTEPDLTSDFSIKANQLYQESIADLKFTADRLRNSQKMLATDAAKANQRVAPGYDVAGNFYDENVGKAFTPNSIDDVTKLVLEDFQKSYSDKGARDQANAKLEQYTTELSNRLKQAQQAGDYGQIDQLTRSLTAIQGAIYDATADKSRASLDAYRRTGGARGGQQKYTDLWDQWNKLKSGDTSALEGVVLPSGSQLENVRINRANNEVLADVVDSKGSYNKIHIGLDDINSGYLQFSQKYDPSWKGVTLDDMMGNNPKVGVKSQEEEVSPLALTEEEKSNMDGFVSVLSDGENKDHINAIGELAGYAASGRLEWPKETSGKDKDGKDIMIPEGSKIINISGQKSGSTGGFFDTQDQFWIEVEYPTKEDETATKLIKVTAKGDSKEKSASKKLLEKIVQYNDIQSALGFKNNDPLGLGL